MSQNSDLGRAVKKQLGWLIALGVVMALLGVIGMIYTGIATLTSVLVFGWLLLIGGFVGLFVALQARKEPGFWPSVIIAGLNIAAGLIVVRRPAESAAVLTLLIAMLLLAGGIFRLIGGLGLSGISSGWSVLQGVLTLILGILVLAGWPSSSLYTIGLFVSLSLLFDGINLVTLGMAGRDTVNMFGSTPQARPSN